MNKKEAPETVELLTELNAIRARNMELTDCAMEMERVARSAVAELEQERKRRKKERDGMAAFIGVGVCLCVIGACALAAPWWTAVTPMVLLVAVMRKARWI